MPHSSTLKSFASTHTTMPYVVIQRSIGFAIQSTSIANCVDSHRQERALVELERDTDIHRQSVDHVVLPGAERIACIYADTVKKNEICIRISCLMLRVVAPSFDNSVSEMNIIRINLLM